MMAFDHGAPAASEAVFGSAARGDADALSDRDMLIVDDDLARLRARSAALSADGWSVASYTFRKLRHLSRTGALFLQHLKLEATIRHDRDDRLAELLGGFRPKARYDAELASNARLAGLVAAVPACPAAELWAADVLFVSVRNYGVLHLAGEGRYHFAYDAILDALAGVGALADGAVPALRSLRFLKSLYRSGEVLPRGKAISMVRDALAGLPGGFFPTTATLIPAGRILIGAAPPDGSAAYHVLRDLERRLLAARSIAGGALPDPELEMLAGWVRDPRTYANLGAAMAPDLRALLARTLVHGRALNDAG